MTLPRVETLGVLLAGGRGLRFGGDKALARFRGRTLIERALEELAAVCDAVVVVAPADLALPVPAAIRVEDAIPHAGPLSALVAGLEARAFDRALALAVDLPRFDRAHLEALREAMRAAEALGKAAAPPALVPEVDGRPQPLAAAYAERAAAALRASLDRGQRALVPAVLALPARLLREAERKALGIPAQALEDADTPADLARIESGARAPEHPHEESRNE